MIDLGFDVWVKNRIRFYGVDTWESRTRDLEEKEKGLFQHLLKTFWKILMMVSFQSYHMVKVNMVVYLESYLLKNMRSRLMNYSKNMVIYEYHGEKKKVFGS